jgi:hypothetical protein
MYETRGYPVDDALRRAHRAQRRGRPRLTALRAFTRRLRLPALSSR